MTDPKPIPPLSIADVSEDDSEVHLTIRYRGKETSVVMLDADRCERAARALTTRACALRARENAVEPGSEYVWAVVYDRGGLSGMWVGDRAEQHAKANAEACGAVVAKLEIVADYRTRGGHG